MTFPVPRPPLPVVAVVLNPRPDVIISPFKVVLGEQAEAQPPLLCLHLAKEAWLRVCQPVAQIVNLFFP